MDDGLKQRLVGAFVLLAIAVIFIPVLFDRERIEPVDKRTLIPAAPHIEPVVIEELTPPTVLSPAKSSDEIYVPEEEVVEPLTPEPKSFDAEGVPNSWVLQVASFRFEKHGQEFRDTIIKDGYPAYTKNVKTSRGDMTRVYIGPKIDKGIMIGLKKKIDKKYSVETILLKFDP